MKRFALGQACCVMVLMGPDDEIGFSGVFTSLASVPESALVSAKERKLQTLVTETHRDSQSSESSE